MSTLFWSLTGLILYVYAGYPLLLVLIRWLGGARPIAVGSGEPQVTIIISAYNEAAIIGEKLENCLALDYRPERMQTIVVSDQSSDDTDRIVSTFSIVALSSCAWRPRWQNAGLECSGAACAR